MAIFVGRPGPILQPEHFTAMKPSIAIVGAGPTAIYTLQALLRSALRPFSVTIFEDQSQVGRGTPYRPGWNDPAMLSNIPSIEIPRLSETLVDWLRRQSESCLVKLGVDPQGINERHFYPRLVLGEYFHDQLQALIQQAEVQGIAVTVRTNCRVLDAISHVSGMSLVVRPRRGDPFEARFDHVVLATGHQWPAEPEVRPGYFLSPWPAAALAKVPAMQVGIRGSSLSAIDAAVALAIKHGDFIESPDGELSYQPRPDTQGFQMTMVSRKGLLPEADFFCPIPYDPLAICTPDAMAALIAAAPDDLLDQAFGLFKQELMAVDPGYAAKIGLAQLDLADFCESYFADRIAVDPFIWAQDNLREAQRNYDAGYTVPWRYAILRMHEVIALLVPHLDQDDFQRFSRDFKQIFVDDYATVPHESIKRLLALHRADKLSVMAVGDDYRIDSHPAETGAVLHLKTQQIHFPIFIEATGQRPLSAQDFPFPSLRKQGIVRNAMAEDVDRGASRGIVIDDQFHPVSQDLPADQLFCLCLPFLLGRHPFIQGITSSHEMGDVVGQELAAAIERGSHRRTAGGAER
jgi:uncharacterized NAD(P)/FAD-binding protein YdhS